MRKAWYYHDQTSDDGYLAYYESDEPPPIKYGAPPIEGKRKKGEAGGHEKTKQALGGIEEGGLVYLPSQLTYFDSKYRWIEAFNHLSDALYGENNNAPKGYHSTILLLRQLAALEAEFVRTATLYGKIIITERFLPDELKTVPPLDIGGIAGGVKVSIIFTPLSHRPTLP